MTPRQVGLVCMHMNVVARIASITSAGVSKAREAISRQMLVLYDRGEKEKLGPGVQERREKHVGARVAGPRGSSV